MVWTEEQKMLLKERYGYTSNNELGKLFGVSARTVRCEAEKLGLEKAIHRKQIIWTPEMLSTLREKYPGHTNQSIADEFQINKKSVVRKAKELGLVKAPELEEKVRVRESVLRLRKMLSYRKIGRILNISKDSVAYIIRKYGDVLPDEQAAIRRQQIKAAYELEKYKRACLLGQNMDRRVLGFDKKRYNMEQRLAGDGYLVFRLYDKVFRAPGMKLHPLRERNAEKMGMVFLEYPQSENISNTGACAPANKSNNTSMIVKGLISEVSSVRDIPNTATPLKVQDFILSIDGSKQQCAFEVYGENIEKFNIQKDEHLEVDIVMKAKKSSSGTIFGHNTAMNVTRI